MISSEIFSHQLDYYSEHVRTEWSLDGIAGTHVAKHVLLEEEELPESGRLKSIFSEDSSVFQTFTFGSASS